MAMLYRASGELPRMGDPETGAVTLKVFVDVALLAGDPESVTVTG
jgi:hypothetical protein